MAAASESKLSALHNKLAEVLAEALDGQTIEAEADEDGVVADPIKIPPSAAILQVAAKFLKDNDITCAPAEDNAVGELKRKLEEKSAASKARRADLKTAEQDMSFLQGLPN